ncbi:MAG: Gfo/Idh/MocA family oxidoreductase [Planctomycetota bacterium]
MIESVGIGILGFGFIGKVHAYGYRVLDLFYDPPPIRPRLVAVCTSSPETARRARDLGPFEFATTDFRQVIERDDVSIIHVCTPNQLHRDALLAAIRAGKHIYCEKPLVADLPEALEIESALASYRAVGQMTLQSRFLPATLRAKGLVDEGFLGNVTSFRACYLHSGSVDPRKPVGWKQLAAFGGGVINDLASHVLDLIDYLIGPLDSVLAETTVLYPERPDRAGASVPIDAEDQVVMLLRLRSGALGTLEASKIATGANDELRFEIHGDAGALRFDLMQPNYLEAYDLRAQESPFGGSRGFTRIETVQRYEPPASFPGPKFAVGWLRGHVHCLHNFLAGVVAGRQVEPSLQRGVRLQKMLDAIRRSAAGHQWLPFEDRRP